MIKLSSPQNAILITKYVKGVQDIKCMMAANQGGENGGGKNSSKRAGPKGSNKPPAAGSEGVASLRKELAVEQKAKDTIEWSNLELERSVRAMEVGICPRLISFIA